jgi:hypothetical protein
MLWWSSRTLTKKSQSLKRFNLHVYIRSNYMYTVYLYMVFKLLLTIFVHVLAILNLIINIILSWDQNSFILSFFVVPCYDEVQGHWQKSRNLWNDLMNENINIWNIRKRITPDRTHTNYRISIWCQICKLTVYIFFWTLFVITSLLWSKHFV